MDSRYTGFYLAIVIFITLLFGCTKDYKPPVKYRTLFRFTMDAFSDTLHIGDTINFNVSFSRTTSNINSGGDFYLPEELVDHAMGITKIDQDSITINSIYYPGAVDDFDVIALKGEVLVKYHTWFYRLGYSFSEDSVWGSFQFIPRDTGIFVFYIQDLAFTHYRAHFLGDYGIVVGDDPERSEYYAAALFENANTENGYYLIEKYSVHYDTTEIDLYSIDEYKRNLRYGTFSVVVNN